MEATTETTAEPGAQEPTALFVNSASRTGLERFEEILACLRATGVRLVEGRAVDDPEALPRLVREAVDAGVTRVLVGGGDGTLSAAAAELADRDVRMGVLPLGTGNDFARSLRIPWSVEGACDAALHGRVVRVDLGMADERPFLNAASIGLSSAITRRLSDDLKRRLGRAAFAVIAAGEAFSHRPFHVKLDADGRYLESDVHQVVVGNGRYHGGGQLVAPEATHQDSQLDVYLIGSEQDPRAQREEQEEADAGPRLRDLWSLFRVATLLRKGRHLELPAVQHLRVSAVRISADPPQEVDVDGELAGHTPTAFSVRPRALQVLVPQRVG